VADDAHDPACLSVLRGDPSDLTPGLVLAAVDDVLGNPRYRQRAAAIAAEIAVMPGPDAAVRRLEGLV